MKPIQSKEEWLNEQSKEQLIIFYKNQEYEIERLRDKLTLLTGCPRLLRSGQHGPLSYDGL